MNNPYTTLRIDKTASNEEIKRAYRKIAVKCHPDKDPSKEAEKRFREASEAYEILKDPKKRSNFDNYGSADGNSFFRGAGPTSNRTRSYSFDDFNIDFEDIFGNGGPDPVGWNEFVNKVRKNGWREARRNGETLQVRISLTLEEVATGTSKTVKYKRKIVCPDCSGVGSINGDNKVCGNCGGSGFYFGVYCKKCGGSGKLTKTTCGKCHGQRLAVTTEELSFDVPKGVTKDNKLTVKGKGNESPDGGAFGDFIVNVDVLNHSVYTRMGDNLATHLDIDNIDAVLGTHKTIQSIYGSKLKVKIPPNTQVGYKLRVPGQGLPNRYSGVNGDLMINIRISMPKEISEEEKELYEKLKEIRDNNRGDSHDQ